MRIAEVPLLARDGSVREVALVDQDDLDRIMAAGPWHLSGGYVTKTVGLHRFVMLGTNLNNDQKVDHRDRNPLNNCRSNLRLVDDAASVQNRKNWGVSRYRGVYRLNGKWAANGRVGGVRYHLGSFESEEEAAEVAARWRAENLPYCEEQ